MTLQQCQAIADALWGKITFEVARGRVYLSWTDFRGDRRRFRWDAPEGSHYPTWSCKLPFGGTMTTAFDLLIRYLQGKPSIPLGTWCGMVSGPAKLAGGNGPTFLRALDAAGWPAVVPCILCGKEITLTGDWWTIGEKGKRNRKSGPSCSMRDCRQPEVGAA